MPRPSRASAVPVNERPSTYSTNLPSIVSKQYTLLDYATSPCFNKLKHCSLYSSHDSKCVSLNYGGLSRHYCFQTMDGERCLTRTGLYTHTPDRLDDCTAPSATECDESANKAAHYECSLVYGVRNLPPRASGLSIQNVPCVDDGYIRLCLDDRTGQGIHIANAARAISPTTVAYDCSQCQQELLTMTGSAADIAHAIPMKSHRADTTPNSGVLGRTVFDASSDIACTGDSESHAELVLRDGPAGCTYLSCRACKNPLLAAWRNWNIHPHASRSRG